MKTILFFVVLLGSVLYASPLSEDEKAFAKEIRGEIKKEVRANVTKLIGELNAALDKHIAIADDKSKSLDEKVKDLLKLRQENPKVYHVLWAMFEKFIPPRFFYKRHEKLSETEKAEIDEAKKEVRTKIRKLTGELSAVLDKRSAILDNKSKTHEQKLKALSELRKENPDANDILYDAFAQFFSKRGLYEKLAFTLSKQSDNIEKVKEGIVKEVRAKVTKLIGELNEALGRQNAIFDDKLKTFKEKSKALQELRKENPKVYNVLWAIYEQFTPKFGHLCKIFKKLNDTEKEKVSEALKEVRANVTKLIGDMRTVFDRGTEILDDKSKNLKDKMKALWELSKENSKANDILNIAIEQFIPRRFRRPRTPLWRRLFGKLNETEKAELKKAMEEIKKEVRENVKKLIGELNEAMEKQIAIVDDQSKSLAEKHKALWESRKQNLKANNVLWVIFEQLAPRRGHFHTKERLNETEKAIWEERKKEARANVTKFIGKLNAMLDRKTAILDDNSKTPREKLRALRELRKENPKVYNVLRTVYEQFIPKRMSFLKSGPPGGRRESSWINRPRPRFLRPRPWHFGKNFENLTETEKKAKRDKMRKEVRENVKKIIGELDEALHKQTAIFDDKSKTLKEKMEAFAKLRRENPKVYRVLRFMFRQFAPKSHFDKYASLSETEKAEMEKVRDEMKKEVRAKVIKIIGELSAALSKKTAILDDKSKTPKEKLEALWTLRKENPEVYDVLGTIFEISFPRPRFLRKATSNE